MPEPATIDAGPPEAVLDDIDLAVQPCPATGRSWTVGEMDEVVRLLLARTSLYPIAHRLHRRPDEVRTFCAEFGFELNEPGPVTSPRPIAVRTAGDTVARSSAVETIADARPGCAPLLVRPVCLTPVWAASRPMQAHLWSAQDSKRLVAMLMTGVAGETICAALARTPIEICMRCRHLELPLWRLRWYCSHRIE